MFNFQKNRYSNNLAANSKFIIRSNHLYQTKCYLSTYDLEKMKNMDISREAGY